MPKISKLNRNRIDLHVHSTHSDGRLSPQNILRQCSQERVNMVALADHDRLTPDLRAVARSLGIRLVISTELGCYRNDPTKMEHPLHILGYGIAPSSNKILNKLAALDESRRNDCSRFRQALEAEGLEVREEDVLREAKGQIPRRFHYSGATAKNPNNFELLSRLSPDPKLKYATLRQIMSDCVSRTSVLSPAEATNLIKSSGGFPVLAHPCHKSDGWPTPDSPGLAEFIEEHLPLGLIGMECYSSHHQSHMIPQLIKIATDLNLAITGGTDFHGREGERLGAIKFKDVSTFIDLTDDMLNPRGCQIIYSASDLG
ncbi:MAG: hypothetical protein KKB81_05510 [Candidatus Margulisbacteria bacterium]|nr:hypothetical protein [Candidatus Margulisiibacteriota bacterium]MBU1021282.1 hypothetical protein [Candidatus Margulisiibacteriota bacterium]MBU1729229.1 hypothetical protein [Candidatus Margulisiibacteriota bacterium]MBU1954902.1 hypothetical protein [Candidatus Margulisiibacteriota bacterium]